MSARAKIRFVILEGELDEEMAERLRDAISSPETTVIYAVPTLADIIERVSYETGVSGRAIVSQVRDLRSVRARFAAAWVGHRWACRTLHEVGLALGDRDHSSIAHAVGRAQQMRERDAAFLALTDKVIAHFTGGKA